jgi:hypothetical protein
MAALHAPTQIPANASFIAMARMLAGDRLPTLRNPHHDHCHQRADALAWQPLVCRHSRPAALQILPTPTDNGAPSCDARQRCGFRRSDIMVPPNRFRNGRVIAGAIMARREVNRNVIQHVWKSLILEDFWRFMSMSPSHRPHSTMPLFAWIC